MQIGVLKSESTPMVAMVPANVSKYVKDGYSIMVESGAGQASFYSDALYAEAGAKVDSRLAVITSSDLLLVDANLSESELSSLQSSTILIGKFNVLNEVAYAERLKQSEIQIFSLDLVPRSSIAQSMDVLSSLASLAGYKAVISAAELFPGYFPMMTTAAGTVPPAKVLVLGAGVAGLQAIATAKRLGASVEAFDVRSAVKEEVESLGAKFIEVPGSVEDQAAGGYAVTQTPEYIQKQKELIHEKASKADILITTANIPGKKAPILIENRTVEAMKPGSVIVDMASASGGNCELSQDNEQIEINDVKILGDSKLFHHLPKEASRLYGTNIYNFLKFIMKEGVDRIPYEHEIVRKTLITERKEMPASV